MGLRDLWDIYKINIGDLEDVCNFKEKNSLYYKTIMQRYKDLKEYKKIELGKKKKIAKEDYINF